jgi:hypothetical protein
MSSSSPQKQTQPRPAQRAYTSPNVVSRTETREPYTETHTIMLASTPPATGSGGAAKHSKWIQDGNMLIPSPTSMSSDEDNALHNDRPVKPKHIEPDWEIMKPATAVTISPGKATRIPLPSNSATNQRKGRSRGTTMTSSTSSNISSSEAVSQVSSATTVSAPSNADEAEVAAAISIARQISVSQKQRQLLIPLKTKDTTAGQGRTRPASPGMRVSPETLMGAGADRLLERKPLTPTLVEIEGADYVSRHRHRKSERVVLEDA